MATLLIPDVSEWQTDVDFAALKRQNGGAVILRAAYGASHPDLKFAAWRTRAHNAGLPAVGIYQYIVAGQDITTQAKAFVALVGKRNAGEWFIADIEEGSGDQSGRAKTWISYVQQHLGGVCWVYSGESFSGSHGLRSVAPLWIAAYRSTEPTAKHVLWQCTNGKDGAHVTSWPGAGKCDTSLYHGSLADLVKLIGGATPEEDDVPIRSSYSLTKAEPIPWSTQTVLDWQAENADPDNAHSGSNPGYVSPLASWVDMQVKLSIGGLDVERGDEYQVTWQVHNWDDKTGKSTSTWTECGADFPATSGHQYAASEFSKGLAKHQHVYVAVTCYPGDGDTSRPAPTVTYGRWTVAQDKA